MQIMQTFVNLDAAVAITAYVVACGIAKRFVQRPGIDTRMIFVATHMTVTLRRLIGNALYFADGAICEAALLVLCTP